MPACAGMDGTRRRCVSQRRGLQGLSALRAAGRALSTMDSSPLRAGNLAGIDGALQDRRRIAPGAGDVLRRQQ